MMVKYKKLREKIKIMQLEAEPATARPNISQRGPKT
jgi:hypothetical protein